MHGQTFAEGAAKINDALGKNFVTEQSDTSYEIPANTQEFYLLIMRMSPNNNRLGWTWAARLSPQAKEQIIKECSEREGKLVMTTNEKWLSGPKIKRFGGMAVPPVGSDGETELRRLYDNPTPR